MRGKSAWDYYKAGKYDKAAALWLPEASKGGVDVQYNLACCYVNMGNPKRGAFWLEKAAAGGDREAMEDLAEMYFDGTLELDIDKSFYYCVEAAKKNSIRAKKLILKLIDPIAKSGSQDSRYFMAYCCLSGKHMDINEEKGFELMEALAAEGRSDAKGFMDIKNDVAGRELNMILTHKHGGNYGYVFCMMQWQIKLIMGKIFTDGKIVSINRTAKKGGKVYVKYPELKNEIQYTISDYNLGDVNAPENRKITEEQNKAYRAIIAGLFGDVYIRDYLFAPDSISIVTNTDKFVKQLSNEQIIEAVSYLAFRDAAGAIVSENYENSNRIVIDVARKEEKIIDKYLVSDYSCTLLNSDGGDEVTKLDIADFRIKMYEIFGIDYAKELFNM